MVKIVLSHTKRHMTFVQRACVPKTFKDIHIEFLTFTPNCKFTPNYTSAAEPNVYY